MKLTINTTAKTITIESEITAGELFDELQKMFGDNWKEYKILIGVITNTITIKEWVNPYINPVPYLPYTPTTPWITF